MAAPRQPPLQALLAHQSRNLLRHPEAQAAALRGVAWRHSTPASQNFPRVNPEQKSPWAVVEVEAVAGGAQGLPQGLHADLPTLACAPARWGWHRAPRHRREDRLVPAVAQVAGRWVAPAAAALEADSMEALELVTGVPEG